MYGDKLDLNTSHELAHLFSNIIPILPQMDVSLIIAVYSEEYIVHSKKNILEH